MESVQLEWLDELAPVHIVWSDGRRLKLTYAETGIVGAEVEKPEFLGPEVQVKLLDCFQIKGHPTIGEGVSPLRLALQAPDGKRLEVTSDFPRWREGPYLKLRPQLRTKYSGFVWP